MQPRLDAPTATRSQARVRVEWIDMARGFGILLVVFGHDWRGIHEAGRIELNDTLFRVVDQAIYAFHMPLFFMLSGLFFPAYLMKQGRTPQDLLGSRATRLLWPMTIWTWLFVGLRIATGDATNKDLGLSDFPVIPLPPQAHFWFLWALFCIQVAFVVLLIPPGRRLARRHGAALFGVIAVAFALYGWFDWSKPALFKQAIIHMPYFATGMILSRHVAWQPGGATTSGAIVIALLLIAAAPFIRSETILHGLALVICLAILTAFAGLGRSLARGRIGPILSRLGLASMVIYLSHTIFSAGARIALLKAGVQHAGIHLAVGVAVGIAAPFMLFLGLRKHRTIARWLGV